MKTWMFKFQMSHPLLINLVTLCRDVTSQSLRTKNDFSARAVARE